MKTRISLLLLLSCFTAASASAGDAAGKLRDRVIFCNQFVIAEPGPASIGDIAESCCRFGNRFRDCHVIDLDEPQR